MTKMLVVLLLLLTCIATVDCNYRRYSNLITASLLSVPDVPSSQQISATPSSTSSTSSVSLETVVDIQIDEAPLNITSRQYDYIQSEATGNETCRSINDQYDDVSTNAAVAATNDTIEKNSIILLDDSSSFSSTLTDEHDYVTVSYTNGSIEIGNINITSNSVNISSSNSETILIDSNSSSVYGLDEDVLQILNKYSDKVICCQIPQYPHCDIFLCGSLHVAQTSADMVRDVIEQVKPSFVVLELCEARIDSLLEQEVANVTLSDIVKESVSQKSVKVFAIGLLTWMQLKAAKITGNKLGGELAAAAKAGALCKSTIVLGDRLYAVTIQRIFDKLKVWEKLTMVFVLLWEILTMSLFKLKDYIHKSEKEKGFIEDEMRKFSKHLPSLANVIINERDEYLAQTICEIARVGFSSRHTSSYSMSDHRIGQAGRGKILAVVGAGHLPGIKKWLDIGGISDSRIDEISSSSKHPSTWPGRGMLQVVNTDMLFSDTASTEQQ